MQIVNLLRIKLNEVIDSFHAVNEEAAVVLAVQISFLEHFPCRDRCILEVTTGFAQDRNSALRQLTFVWPDHLFLHTYLIQFRLSSLKVDVLIDICNVDAVALQGLN